MRPFENWTYEQVEEEFGLIETKQLGSLAEWLDAGDIELTETDEAEAEELRLFLSEEVINWNEDELKLFFIAPMLNLAKLHSPYFKMFSQRSLSILRDSTLIAAGKVDFLFARGKATPKQPYFCLHEYKQENRRENDPRGQVLIAMVAAREKNEPELPVYGIYVVGRLWFFGVLDGNRYAFANAFTASDDDILDILRILRKCKILIESHVAALVV